MTELRIYVTGPKRFRLTTGEPIPQFDVHVITGPHRTCTSGFWCPRCHPQLDPTRLRPTAPARMEIPRG